MLKNYLYLSFSHHWKWPLSLSGEWSLPELPAGGPRVPKWSINLLPSPSARTPYLFGVLLLLKNKVMKSKSEMAYFGIWNTNEHCSSPAF